MPDEDPCNCQQAVELTEALRRLIAACGSCGLCNDCKRAKKVLDYWDEATEEYGKEQCS
jgi:hypothetical protein